jgi:hypothetical protein
MVISNWGGAGVLNEADIIPYIHTGNTYIGPS